MVDVTIQCLTQIMETAIPVAVCIEFTNLLASMLLRAAFGGKLWFGR